MRYAVLELSTVVNSAAGRLRLGGLRRGWVRRWQRPGLEWMASGLKVFVYSGAACIRMALRRTAGHRLRHAALYFHFHCTTLYSLYYTCPHLTPRDACVRTR